MLFLDLLDMTSMMRKKKIKLRSVEIGIPLALLAKELGVSRQFVYQVCAGQRMTSRIRAYICHRLGFHPTHLGWPETHALERPIGRADEKSNLI